MTWCIGFVHNEANTLGQVVLPGFPPLHFVSVDRSPVCLLNVYTGATSTQQNQEEERLPGHRRMHTHDRFTAVNLNVQAPWSKSPRIQHKGKSLSKVIIHFIPFQ